MAIIGPITEVNRRELSETASSCVSLRRVVNDDMSVSFPVSVSYITNVFEIDATGTKLSRLREENHTTFDLTPEEANSLFTLPLKLADDTQTTLGNLLADLTDVLIQARLNG